MIGSFLGSLLGNAIDNAARRAAATRNARPWRLGAEPGEITVITTRVHCTRFTRPGDSYPLYWSGLDSTAVPYRRPKPIESGRSAPGRNMVVRPADSMDLPLRERHELLLHAGYAPAPDPSGTALRLAVPLHLRSSYGELRPMTTVLSFATAVDVPLSELKLEAFLPTDPATADALLAAAAVAD
ncbi:hypothetical protein [Streptomyces filamentosus]